MGGDPRPLGAQRLLEHLHDHLLPFAQAVLDGQGVRIDEGAAAGRLHLLGREQVLGQLLEDVGHVQEGVALLADVDEGRLHPGQDPGHLALIEVPDDPAVGFPLDEDLGDDAVVQERDLGLLGGTAHDEVFGHGRSLP